MDPTAAPATFAATLVDEWVRCGLTDAVVAPGSRSTPMTLALARHAGVRLHVHLDERSAGFIAVGLGLATGRPAVVVTTSGTAAVELHPAVVEADLAGVPLLACTTDRPPDLRGIGAPQTVDQRGLFGGSVRASVDLGVARPGAGTSWRSVAARAWLDAATGPVHLNLPFDDPLLAEPDALPQGRPEGAPWHTPVPGGAAVDVDLAGLVAGRPGVVVAGRGVDDPAAVQVAAGALGWPVLADPLSGCRTEDPTTVAASDLLLRSGAWAAAHRPEVALRLGGWSTSKALAAWLGEVDVQIMADPQGRWVDPGRLATHVLRAPASAVAAALGGARPAPEDWLLGWQDAERRAQESIDEALGEEVSEPAVARRLTRELAPGEALVVSSSMPIRDVEWFGVPTSGRVLANRGANGIDGVVSTAVGVALSGVPTTLLVGDLAFLHDTNGLLGLAGRGVDLRIVVVDNDGGGIFSFLPQAEALPTGEFERLFATPHGLDLFAVAKAHGAEIEVVRTDRAANVEVHRRVAAAVAAALG